MNRYDYFKTTVDEADGKPYKGFLDDNFLASIKEASYIYYKIPISLQYRPDIISKLFYNDDTKFWVLAYANEINDSPAGFYTDRKIKIVDPNFVSQL